MNTANINWMGDYFSGRAEAMVRIKAALLFVLLLPVIAPGVAPAGSQEKPPAPSTRVVVEMNIRYWGMAGDGRRQALLVRLYADGRTRYEKCKDESGRELKAPVMKEARVKQEEVDGLLKLIEA